MSNQFHLDNGKIEKQAAFLGNKKFEVLMESNWGFWFRYWICQSKKYGTVEMFLSHSNFGI